MQPFGRKQEIGPESRWRQATGVPDMVAQQMLGQTVLALHPGFFDKRRQVLTVAPSPTLSPTDSVPHRAHLYAANKAICRLYTAFTQPIYSIAPLHCLLPLRWREARVLQPQCG